MDVFWQRSDEGTSIWIIAGGCLCLCDGHPQYSFLRRDEGEFLPMANAEIVAIGSEFARAKSSTPIPPGWRSG